MDYFKIVNVNAPIPVKTTTPPIYGVRTGIKMTYSDILKCLCRRATIHQVLSDGSTVQLTTKNFRYDFEADLQAKKAAEAVVEKPVEKDPKEEPHIGTYSKADKYKAIAQSEGTQETHVADDDEQPTGSIDDIDMLSGIDDEDHSDADEPEEPSAEVEEHEPVKEVPTKKQTKTRKKNSSKK